LLGQAAILEGSNVVQTQSALGDAQRGGLSASELIIDKDEIVFQQVEQPDLILALSESAIKKYGGSAANVLVLFDNSASAGLEGQYARGVPFTKMAESIPGGAANMVALGTILSLTQVVSPDSLFKAIRQSMSEASAQANIESVQAGMAVAKTQTAGK
jgi:2-oxoglutarate ferredoxin oxidoreductase subunit gamma